MSYKYTFIAKVPVYTEQTKYLTKTVQAKSYAAARKSVKDELKLERYKVNDYDIEEKSSPLLSMICFAIVIFFSFFTYYQDFRALELFPNALDLISSILIYSSFVIRIKGVKNTFTNIKDIILSVEVITVVAIFIKMLSGTGETKSNIILDFLNKFGIAISNGYFLIFLGVLLSWVGLKPVAGVVWILLFLSGLASITNTGLYMGNIVFYVFIIMTFLGVIMYLKYEGPVIINSIKNAAVKAKNYIGSDLASTKRAANRVTADMIAEKSKKKTSDTTVSKLED